MSILSSIKKGISNVVGSVKGALGIKTPIKTYTPAPKLDLNKAIDALNNPQKNNPLNIPSALDSMHIGGVTTPNLSVAMSQNAPASSLNAPAKAALATYNSRSSANKTIVGTTSVPNSNGGSTKMNVYADGTTAPASVSLAGASAPTNINGVSTVGTPGVANTNMGIGNVAGAVAATNGIQARIDAEMAANQEALQAKKDADALRAQQEKENKSIFKFLNREDNIREDTTNQAWKETGIKPSEYFADQRARIAEIDSLTQNYNAVVAQRDTQIAQTNDKLASMNFINNQVAQINRNAAPVLNQMSANINAKAATMQALQGNFAEAQKFVNQAVDDAVADKKDKVDSFKMFYDINQNSIDKLDSKYKDALNQASAIAEMEYKQAYDDKKLLGDLMIANPNAGIDILRDTPDDAYAKIARSGGSTDYKLAVSQENRLSGKAGTEDKPATTSDIDWAKSQIGFGDLQIPYGTTQSGLSTIAALDWSDPVTKSNYKNNVDGFKTWVTSVLQGNLK